MHIASLDLEGVLIPEIWISLAEQAGIPELRLTTRDIADYDVLMKRRLSIIAQHDLCLSDVQSVVDSMEPLPGAGEFLDWLRERYQIVILSDTFYEFALPLIRKLGWPTLFCNKLEVDQSGRIVNYRLRQSDPKRQAIKALHALNFRVVATGDSYNDTSMLMEADAGILFRPPDDLARENSQLPVAHTYDELKTAFLRASEQLVTP